MEQFVVHIVPKEGVYRGGQHALLSYTLLFYSVFSPASITAVLAFSH